MFTMDIKRLLDVATADGDSRLAVVIVNVNAQSLAAHAGTFRLTHFSCALIYWPYPRLGWMLRLP
jgi:hypothetical protein